MARKTLKDLEALIEKQDETIRELKDRIQILESRPVICLGPHYPQYPIPYWEFLPYTYTQI